MKTSLLTLGAVGLLGAGVAIHHSGRCPLMELHKALTHHAVPAASGTAAVSTPAAALAVSGTAAVSTPATARTASAVKANAVVLTSAQDVAR